MSAISETKISAMSLPRRFTSPFAPLNPEGPLPPGVTEVSVVKAYKNMGFKPKQVLFTLKVKQFKETSATRLRRALNRPGARGAREEKHIPPFHYAI